MTAAAKGQSGYHKLNAVHVGERSISAYEGVVPDEIMEALYSESKWLRGARVLHLNATPFGGGVSEILRSAVPLLNDLGLHAEWRVIHGNGRFFDVTKAMHNGLQGDPKGITEAEMEIYLETSHANAQALQVDYDYIFVHDPQPVAILSMIDRGAAKWVWRCHIDTSKPNPTVWGFLHPFMKAYDAVVYTMPEFVPKDADMNHVAIIPPAIDPLSPKNMNLPIAMAREILDYIGINPAKPLITQVSRFDPWKDPMGVIAAYKLVKQEIPDLQLAMVGSMAMDDPEGWTIYEEVCRAGEDDGDLHTFSNLTGVGNIEVNAFQRESQLCVQKSIREGFGLVVSETLWKGTPMVAGRAGGIVLQMEDGVGGMLVDSVDECAQAIHTLLTQPHQAREMAASGRKRVREEFLLPRHLLDELKLMQRL